MSCNRILNLSFIIEGKEYRGRAKVNITEDFPFVDFSFSCVTIGCSGRIWKLKVPCGDYALSGTHNFWVFRDPVDLSIKCEGCKIVSVSRETLNKILQEVVADEILASEMNPHMVDRV